MESKGHEIPLEEVIFARTRHIVDAKPASVPLRPFALGTLAKGDQTGQQFASINGVRLAKYTNSEAEQDCFVHNVAGAELAHFVDRYTAEYVRT